VPAVDVPAVIVCVDCGGRCHLLAYTPPEEGWQPGDIVAYRCEDCLDRWDLVVPEDVDTPGASPLRGPRSLSCRTWVEGTERDGKGPSAVE
jgi:hypothetical protein